MYWELDFLGVGIDAFLKSDRMVSGCVRDAGGVGALMHLAGFSDMKCRCCIRLQ